MYQFKNKLYIFLDKKNIVFSSERYLQDALSSMTFGLFASLLIGLIFKTLGEQSSLFFGSNYISTFFISTGKMAMSLMGASIGASVAFGLKAPPLVIFSSLITGSIGASLGGPAGAFIASSIGAEFGKAISKETKIDIIFTPAVTITVGSIVGTSISPLIGNLMTYLGNSIIIATKWQPLFFGIFIAVIVGLTLTAPISSAALCIMLDLSGLAAGAATSGCAAQMIGFAVISYKENGFGGLIAQGLGTSMLQVSNIIKNPWILVPPTLSGAILGAISTTIFKMTNNSLGAGMGTSGLVGQITTFNTMGFTSLTLLKVLVLHFLLPTILSLIFYVFLKHIGKIKENDCKLKI